MVEGYEICRMVNVRGELQPASGPAHANPAAIKDVITLLRVDEPDIERRPYKFRWVDGVKEREELSDAELADLASDAGGNWLP